MTRERIQLSIETVKDNIKILEEQEPEDAGYYLQLEHEKFVLVALEKQIPKKPKFEDEKDYWGNIVGGRYRCSECDRFICHAEELSSEEDYPYCHCGQKIDWSDTDEQNYR